MKAKNLAKELDFLLSTIQKKIRTFPWEDRICYSAWLAQTYYFARHTTRLLALAGAHTSFAAPEYHTRFLQHCAEERGHEKILLNDLKALGSAISEWPERPGTCALYQSQYYYVEHASPMAFFGYILGLEALAAHFGAEITQRLESAYGPKASCFMRVHSEEDVGHVAEALAKIYQLPEDLQPVIIQNLRQTLKHYDELLEDCIELAHSKNARAA